MSSIQWLLKAAEYLERRDREAEHGYAVSPGGGQTRASDSSSPERGNGLVVLSGQQSPTSGGHGGHHGPVALGLKNHDLPHARASRRARAKKPLGNRSTHNELEKNRRAHLRNCLEKLKEIVPVGPESSRHTTLGLLTKAKSYIKSLEDKERRQRLQREQLLRKKRYLERLRDQVGFGSLTMGVGMASLPSPTSPVSPTANCFPQMLTPPHSSCSSRHDSPSSSVASVASVAAGLKRRSVSECSSQSSSTTSTSESDEVDILGYNSGSNHSDTDDHSSIQSVTSDGGVTISTKRLCLQPPTTTGQPTSVIVSKKDKL